MQTQYIETSNLNELIRQITVLVNQGWQPSGDVQHIYDVLQGQDIVVMRQKFSLEDRQQVFFSFDSTVLAQTIGASDE